MFKKKKKRLSKYVSVCVYALTTKKGNTISFGTVIMVVKKKKKLYLQLSDT